MRTVLTASALVALSIAAASDDPKTKARADRLINLITGLEKDQKAAAVEYDAARGEKDKKAAEDKFLGIGPAYALKMYKLAEEDPKDEVGFDAALAAFHTGMGGSTAKKAVDLLLAHHTENPKLRPALPALAVAGEPGLAALKTIAEQAKDVETKGLSLYYYGATTLENADNPRSGKPLPAEERAARFRDAEAILNRAAKEFGEVAVRSGTVAEEVKGQLFFLNNLTVGKTLPDAESEDLTGRKTKISDHRGKVVVLDVWATWCVPCRAMIPHERELVGRMKGKPFVLVSLSADEKKETLTKFLDETPMPWTHWWNGGARGGAVDAYRVKTFPTVFVLDAEGVIRHKHLRGADLEKAVEKLLDGKGG